MSWLWLGKWQFLCNAHIWITVSYGVLDSKSGSSSGKLLFHVWRKTRTETSILIFFNFPYSIFNSFSQPQILRVNSLRLGSLNFQKRRNGSWYVPSSMLNIDTALTSYRKEIAVHYAFGNIDSSSQIAYAPTSWVERLISNCPFSSRF